MKLTTALKAHLIANGLAVAGDSDEKFIKATDEALVNGKLTGPELTKLVGEETKKETIANLISKSVEVAVKGMIASGGMTASNNNNTESHAESGGEFDKAFGKLISRPDTEEVTATKLFGEKAEIRVKTTKERYGCNRSTLVFPKTLKSGVSHPLGGQPVTYMGRTMESTSNFGKALGAAWFKFMLKKNTTNEKEIPHCLRLKKDDMDLIHASFYESNFTGAFNIDDDGDETVHTKTINNRRLNANEIKALLDDNTSGGIEIAPIEFDDALVTYPLLHSELLPYVTVMPVSRGRRMKGGSVINPTFGSSTEGTAVVPFDTATMVAAFDTNIYVAAGAMEIGLDFEDDSPTNIGEVIITKYGERALEWYDRVIADGNGTTEPLGVLNTSGAVSLNSDNGSSGPPTVSDYEGLLFGVAKQYRSTKGSRNVFIGNETSYRRARGIAVGPSDERRVFGMNETDYMLLGQPYAIQQQIANNKIAYANLGYYRLYRRLGQTVRLETAGSTLALANKRLIIVRMRIGGRMELGGACSVMTDAQS